MRLKRRRSCPRSATCSARIPRSGFAPRRSPPPRGRSRCNGVVHVLTAGRRLAQWRERAEVESQVDGLPLLQGIEVNILEGGSLALPDAVLEILDLVIASPRVKLRQSEQHTSELQFRP